MSSWPYPHLTIYFATESSLAVILRRGPSQWRRMILWHTDTDEFELGQWFRGTINSCDLSADGRAFLYNGAKYKPYLRSQNVWVALSKPPYFTAFALLDRGSFYNIGEKMFVGNTEIYYSFEIEPTSTKDGGTLPSVFRLTRYSDAFPLFLRRLERDGWQLQNQGMATHLNWKNLWESKNPVVWHKTNPRGTLIRQSKPTSTYRVEKMFFEYQGQRTHLENNACANFDQEGRLIGIRGWQLLSLDYRDPNQSFTVLANFEDQKPDNIPAPEWVKTW